jgi:hypothetical protein
LGEEKPDIGVKPPPSKVFLSVVNITSSGPLRQDFGVREILAALLSLCEPFSSLFDTRLFTRIFSQKKHE